MKFYKGLCWAANCAWKWGLRTSSPPEPTVYCIYGGNFTQGTTPFVFTTNGEITGISDGAGIGLFLQGLLGPLSGGGESANQYTFWAAVPEGEPNPFTSATYYLNGEEPNPIEVTEIGCAFVNTELITTTINRDASTWTNVKTIVNYVSGAWEVNIPYDSINTTNARAYIRAMFGQQADITVTIVTPTQVVIEISNILYDGSGTQLSTDFIDTLLTNYT